MYGSVYILLPTLLMLLVLRFFVVNLCMYSIYMYMYYIALAKPIYCSCFNIWFSFQFVKLQVGFPSMHIYVHAQCPLHSHSSSLYTSDLSASPASAKSLKSPAAMPPPLGTPTRLQTLRNQSLKLHLPGSGRNYISLGLRHAAMYILAGVSVQV